MSETGMQTSGMPRAAFTFWRVSRGYTKKQAAEVLGRGESTLRRWESTIGKPQEIPFEIALACAAEAAGVPPYGWDERLGVMPPSAFIEFRRLMGAKLGQGREINQVQAAELLGMKSKETISYWELGRRRDSGQRVTIDKSTALACAALLNDLEPWTREA
ncbi:hypothetical protein [Azospirillum sp. SYSU D00513]|uniref:hypothetical protein n=1 Tax=Azospirillum sp. SYSU D00513 TaxID=2812561 RepID=UPI001A96F8EF|nr:hypothetical protein [Azospirillum sp. SYSU D00513]